MGRTAEEPLKIEEAYRALLRAAVAAVGGQERAGELAGVHQTTVGRTLTAEARATYTTLRKLASALPGLPDPVVPVRDARHERWCKLGAQLADTKPEEFALLLRMAETTLASPRPTEESVEKLKAVVASPMVSRRRKKMR